MQERRKSTEATLILILSFSIESLKPNFHFQAKRRPNENSSFLEGKPFQSTTNDGLLLY